MDIVSNPPASPSTLATLAGETYHAPEGAVIVRPLDVPSSVIITPQGSKTALHPFGVIVSVGKGSIIEAAAGCDSMHEGIDIALQALREQGRTEGVDEVWGCSINAVRCPVPHKIGDVIHFAGQPYGLPEMGEGPRFLVPFSQIVSTIEPARLDALRNRLSGRVVAAAPSDALRLAARDGKAN